MPRLKHAHKPGRRSAHASGEQLHLSRVLDQAEQRFNAGDFEGARQILEENRGRFGQYAALRAGLATVYINLGRPQDAAAEARLALELNPRELDYYRLAAVAYFAAGYSTLAHRARQVWLRSALADPQVAEMRELEAVYQRFVETLRAKYGLRDLQTAEEAAYRMDEGRWALTRGQWAEAVQQSQAASRLIPRWPPPRNNASVALYYQGRLQEAIAQAEAVLRECDPNNIHALANLARYYVAAGELARAAPYGDRLAALPLADDPDTALKQAEGLAALDRDADVERILTAAERKFGHLPPHGYVFLGISQANLGHPRKAQRILRQAAEAGDRSFLQQETMQALVQGRSGRGIARRFSYLHYSELLPSEAISGLLKQLKRDEGGKRRDDRTWTELLQRYPQLLAVCRKMLYEMPDGVLPMLRVLVAMRTPAAIEIVREFIRGEEGTDDQRLEALRLLREAELIASNEAVEIRLRGELQKVEPHLQEISHEFVPDYAPEVWKLYEQALTAQRAGKTEEAERLYHQMLAIEPEAKEAYNNLALIYSERGENDRVEECLDKALAIDPLYPFPRSARALQALQRGDLEGAREWLKPLHTVKRWHPLGFAIYQKAMLQIAIHSKDYEGARKSLELIKEVNPDDPEIKRLEANLNLLTLTSDFGDLFRDHDARARERLQRKPLPADPSLADCLGLLSKGDMQGISRVVGVYLRAPYKKADIYQSLLTRLSDKDFLADIVADLNAAERAALADVLAAGGVMSRADFVAAHGDEGEDRPYLEYHATSVKSVIERLRAHGVLYIGTSEGRVVVAVPRELRAPLTKLLSRP